MHPTAAALKEHNFLYPLDSLCFQKAYYGFIAWIRFSEILCAPKLLSTHAPRPSALTLFSPSPLVTLLASPSSLPIEFGSHMIKFLNNDSNKNIPFFICNSRKCQCAQCTTWPIQLELAVQMRRETIKKQRETDVFDRFPLLTMCLEW